jgi:Zn-dependent M28 family amino/carboxypeptidase
MPEQVVLVSGHLDSWDLGTGALDDASGIGIALDVIRILKEIMPTPETDGPIRRVDEWGKWRGGR